MKCGKIIIGSLDMKIEIVPVGIIRCNTYILTLDNKALIIDPGDEYEKIKKKISDKEIVGIIITHHHPDHDGAVSYFKDVKVYDKNNLSEGENNIDCFKFDVIYTPGHKEDLITIYFKKEKIMFVGDFIFKDSIGRCDLPGGNPSEMIKSIEKIKKYDKDITIYPGHGEKTSLGYEINNNPYFKEYM